MRTIFQSFQTPESVQETRTDLARTAGVSKMFSEHALDALWRSLDSLMPLFSILGNAFRQVTLYEHGVDGATTTWVCSVPV